MGDIKVLDENLINKIAAGEVIERPASVIKELIENSIDANATQISIDIEQAGTKLIRVKDNGKGMENEDAEKCILRHATSKIKTVEDLFAINTLGFRGEALASIAAVSNLTITTKHEFKNEGLEIEIEGGILKNKKLIGCPIGTIVEVKNLFFNTPVREKFLAKPQTETAQIIDIISRYALINPQISFKLAHNNQALINTNASYDAKGNIINIYGPNVARDLIMVKHLTPDLKIHGYISKPSLVRNDKSQQSIFVNKRYIKNETITKAIYDGYQGMIFTGKHPIFLLDIIINPKKIDVNVHPTKEKIRLEQENLVYQTIFNAIKSTLKQNDLTFLGDRLGGLVGQKPISKTNLKIKDQGETKILNFENQETFQSEQKSFENLPEMKLLGIVNKTFAIAETKEGILLIDQHVVQERVLYEKFMEQFKENNVETQQLLSTELIELSPKETLIINENIKEFKKLGFDLENFGDNTFTLRSIPSLFNKLQSKDLVKDLTEELLNNQKNSLEETKEEILIRKACRFSIKAGDEITLSYLRKLLLELDKTKNPYTCPHGRPVIIKITLSDLEKFFRRKA
ncbi:MAG: DNA mismatch repair endonuclease MutL [archaeon]